MGWRSSYSEGISSFDFEELESDTISVDHMLAEAKHGIKDIGGDAIKATKEKVYARLVEYLQFQCYPSELNPNFKEANLNELVFYTIGPILSDFKNETEHDIRLKRRRQEPIFTDSDSQTEAIEEFMVDEISVMERSFVVIMETKPSSRGEATRQCLLAMEEMRNLNGKGQVYGFITTGEDWRMVKYDGVTFQMAEKFTVLFHTMGKDKDRWMREGSFLVDCIMVALYNGGIS